MSQGRTFPQGLKPIVYVLFCGTTEVVPFQGRDYATCSSAREGLHLYCLRCRVAAFERANA
jgi:hypothetical protein